MTPRRTKNGDLSILFESRGQVVVRRDQIRRIGWVIKMMEAQTGEFLLSCKCLVSQGIVVQEQDPFGDLSAAFFLQNIEARTFPADFLGRGEPLFRQSIDCCFASGSYWYNQVSSMVTNRGRKSFGSRRKNSKSCSNDWHRWGFWSAIRHFGTHFTESFRMSKSSWVMDPTRSRKMPSCSAIDLAEVRRFSKISSWIW